MTKNYLPKCRYCGQFVNPNKDGVKMGVQYGFMGVDFDYYYHEKCPKRVNTTFKITDILPRESDMENKIKDARQHQEEEHIEFINGYELGYKHCYSWMVRILSLFDSTSQPASSEHS